MSLPATDDASELDQLRVAVDQLTARVHGLSQDLEELGALLAPEESGEPPDRPAPVEPVYPTLDQWVEDYFLATFHRHPGGEFRWCHQWHDHPEAVTRLEALWRAWEVLRLDPGLGIATWLTHHLDPQLPILMGRAGPFASCTTSRHGTGEPEAI